MEGLGGSGFIERDEVSVGIKDCEFMVSPKRFGKWGVRVNYSVTHTLSEQGFNSLDADSATAGFSYSPITARPKVNAYGATGHNAIRSLIRMNPYETKLGTKKLDTPLDVQRRTDWRCDNKLYGLRHAVYSVFLTTGEKLTRAERSEGCRVVVRRRVERLVMCAVSIDSDHDYCAIFNQETHLKIKSSNRGN